MNGAKEFFVGCRRLEQRINGKIEESERLRAIAYKVTTSYTDEPRGGTTEQSRIENAVLRLVELEKEINADIDEMVDHRKEAQAVIASLSDDRYRDVLTWRYFSLWNWERITDAFGFSDRTQSWRLHGRALMEANTILAGNVK